MKYIYLFKLYYIEQETIQAIPSGLNDQEKSLGKTDALCSPFYYQIYVFKYKLL